MLILVQLEMGVLYQSYWLLGNTIYTELEKINIQKVNLERHVRNVEDNFSFLEGASFNFSRHLELDTSPEKEDVYVRLLKKEIMILYLGKTIFRDKDLISILLLRELYFTIISYR